MVSKGNGWVRIFDIPEISKHRKGFTIYKVMSMLYPETCPDAITKLTVWKRFNDFKKLHRDLKKLHNQLSIKDRFPSLPSSTFLKRFDEETLQERRTKILYFLEYVGYHSQLFTSTEFVKFFESSHTPAEHLCSNISSIRANLNLPEDPVFCARNSDDELTISDTDSITTGRDSRLSSITNSKNSDCLSVSTTMDSLTLLDGQIFTTTNTSGCEDGYVQYIVDASLHVNIATELESTGKYDGAFTAYKTAIDILLKYGKDDQNYDRRRMVRYKTEKYLIRAERIYNMYLSSEMQGLKEIIKIERNQQNHGTTNDRFLL